MSNPTQNNTNTEPSQLNGQIKQAQGAVYTAIGSVIPENLGSASYLQSGSDLSKSGQVEVDAAKGKQAAEAVVDSGVAKIQSGIGYITGNQEKQTQGNIDTQKAQFSYKQATSDGIGAIPVPSAEGLKGQFQSVEGILTGDQGKQLEGNTRAEKAAWRDGV